MVLPSNSAGPTPTMMIDMGRHEALSKKKNKIDYYLYDAENPSSLTCQGYKKSLVTNFIEKC